jgi:hypothetical protein
MNADLQRARRALEAGKPDEASVYAWRALPMITDEADQAELLRLARELDDVLLLRELEERGFGRPTTEPTPERETSTSKLRFLPFAVFTIVMVVIVGLTLTDLPIEGRPPDVDETAIRDRPEAHPRLLTLSDGVWLVPVERAETVDLQRIAAEITFRSRIPVGVQRAHVALTPSSLQDSRDDLDAGRVLELLARAYGAEGRATIVGVTDYDMDSSKHGHVFTLRSDRNYAIVSTAQLSASILDRLRGHDRHERTRKLVARNIALLHLGLPMVDDPKSLRRTTMSGIDDIDELEERF